MGNNLNISIFGLGYVGLPLAIKLSNYFNVLGFDKNKQRIKDLKKFLDKNNEVSSKELKKSKLQYSTNINDLKNMDHHAFEHLCGKVLEDIYGGKLM